MALAKIISQNNFMTGPSGAAAVKLSLFTETGPAAYVTGGFDADITTEAMGSVDLSKAEVLVFSQIADAVTGVYDEANKKIQCLAAGAEVAADTDVSALFYILAIETA